jgi:hypothetical protein
LNKNKLLYSFINNFILFAPQNIKAKFSSLSEIPFRSVRKIIINYSQLWKIVVEI